MGSWEEMAWAAGAAQQEGAAPAWAAQDEAMAWEAAAEEEEWWPEAVAHEEAWWPKATAASQDAAWAGSPASASSWGLPVGWAIRRTAANERRSRWQRSVAAGRTNPYQKEVRYAERNLARAPEELVAKAREKVIELLEKSQAWELAIRAGPA